MIHCCSNCEHFQGYRTQRLTAYGALGTSCALISCSVLDNSHLGDPAEYVCNKFSLSLNWLRDESIRMLCNQFDGEYAIRRLYESPSDVSFWRSYGLVFIGPAIVYRNSFMSYLWSSAPDLFRGRTLRTEVCFLYDHDERMMELQRGVFRIGRQATTVDLLSVVARSMREDGIEPWHHQIEHGKLPHRGNLAISEFEEDMEHSFPVYYGNWKRRSKI
jgi:hypothetical protein